MISLSQPHHQTDSAAFHNHSFNHSPHSPHSPLPDQYIPRSASSLSSTADDDYLQSTDYHSSPMHQDYYSQSTSLGLPSSGSVSQVDLKPSQASWAYGENGAGFDPSLSRRLASHRRNLSSSSVGSNASAASSPAYSRSTFSSIGHSEHSPQMAVHKFESYAPSSDEASRTFSNSLPTPTYTPISESYVANLPTYTSQPTNLESAMAAHLIMKHDILDRNSMVEEDIPGFSHSERHSVSSFENSPSTPHVDDIDDAFRAPTTDMSRHSLQPTVRDDYAHAAAMNLSVQTGQFPSQNQAFLSPFSQTKFNEFQKINRPRPQSPSSFAAGRPISPYRQTTGQTGSPLRQQQAMRSYSRSGNATISPKDSLLDHTETVEDQKSLFGSSPADFAPSPQQSQQPQQHNNLGFDQYNDFSQNQFNSTTSWLTTAPTTQAFTFTAPAMDNINRGISFPAQNYRSVDVMGSMPEPTPDFPAHLTSMESSVSEAPDSSQNMPSTVGEARRPVSTLADAGTYSCTYHGCSHRFDSPQRLQKHKREAHRQSATSHSGSSSPIGSNMSAADLLARNSQAGPHKCSRVNPSTGKPCNAVFSRPYDLTRHEDTIHNNIKQKVRCAYCVEEKSFSRNDALTRHMRVVHSDVNYPGKHRRRAGHD